MKGEQYCTAGSSLDVICIDRLFPFSNASFMISSSAHASTEYIASDWIDTDQDDLFQKTS
jgi:hypothetical protein